VLGELVERLRVDARIDRLQQGGHLLDAQALAEGDVDGRDDDPRLHEGLGDLGRRHVGAQQEVARGELVVQPRRQADEHERALVGDEAGLVEARREHIDTVAGVDGEDLLGGVGAGRGVEGGPEILADEVGDERELDDRARVAPRPAHDAGAKDRPEGGEQHQEDERSEDAGEEDELDEPGQPEPALPAAAAVSRIHGRIAPTVRCPPRGHLRLSRGPAVPDRHPIPCPGARRASSSSWRMIAAASRSTRSR
jgi:hypothetical protein